MTKWEFLFGSDRVEVEGTTWLDALGKALGAAGLDSTVLTRLHIDVQPGDRVVVKDPAGRKMVLQPASDNDKSDPNLDLFNIPPDLETEEIPRAGDGKPMPRRGPKPRATNWRVPTPRASPPPRPVTRRVPDPTLATPPVPMSLEADEPPTEEVDPKQLASALAAAHAHAPPAAAVPQRPAPPPIPAAEAEPPEPKKQRRSPRRAPRRRPSMTSPMAPMAGPVAGVHDAPPSPAEAEVPDAALEAPPTPGAFEAPSPATLEAPSPAAIEPPAPEAIEVPEPQLEEPVAPAEPELPPPPVIEQVEAAPEPPAPPAIEEPVAPAEPELPPPPVIEQVEAAPEPPAPPVIEEPVAPAEPPVQDIEQLAESLSPLLGKVMENLEDLEARATEPVIVEEAPAIEESPGYVPALLEEEPELDEPELEEPEAAPAPVADEPELPPPPVLAPAVEEPIFEEPEPDLEEPEPVFEEPEPVFEEPEPVFEEPAYQEPTPEPPPPPAPPPPVAAQAIIPEPAPPPPSLPPSIAPTDAEQVDQILVSKPEPLDDDALPPGFEDDDEPMAVDMDVFGPARPVKPEDLGEWLFEKSMDINEAMDIPEAARMSLQILLDLVGAESGCVLYGDYNAEALEFIAAAGPTAHKLQGVKVDIETSLAGFCHRMGFGILVADAAEDNRFDRSVDEHTGYSTEAILAVPIRATDGDTYGCIELLNAYYGFEEWMMDASQNIATTLAGYIQARL
jgi:hypothetical protein